MNRPTLKQRRAQSARDRARNAARRPMTVTKNAPLARSQSFARPNVRMSSTADKLVISHTEVIASLTGTDQFSSQGIFINPGLPGVLPWGSQIAAAYDYYVPKSVTLTMKPSLPATEPGMVYMYADSDIFDSAPTSMISASGNAHFKSASVWAGMSQTYPASFFHTRRMFKVRSGAYPNESSADDYDCARIWVGSEGLSGDKPMGYLTMTYVFELHNPTVRDVGLSSVKLSLRDGLAVPTAPADTDIDLRHFVVTDVKGRPPVDLSVGDVPTMSGLKLTKAFNGTIGAKLANLIHYNHTADPTLVDQDGTAFTHRFEGETETKSDSNITRFIDAVASGFHQDLESSDDFFIKAKRDAIVQPRIRRPGVNTEYRGSANTALNTIEYLFNVAKDTARFLA